MKKELLSVLMALIAIILPTQSWAQENIQFADNAVKAICIANWDTNGDGELSYDEAAAVTDIGTVFSGSNISHFIELEYFSSLTAIHDSAFYRCLSLEEINIPENATKIGVRSFASSGISLCEMNKVESINDVAFEYCQQLVSVFIPQTLTSISPSAFSKCSNLVSIFVDEENSVYDSRLQCNAIIETATNTLVIGCKSTIIPDDIETIGRLAFAYCNFDQPLTFPSSLRTIGDWAFLQCSGLSEITFPEGLERIAWLAFRSNHDLQHVTFPSTLTQIGSESFEHCNLTSITIPASLRNIPSNAFDSNSHLVEITVEEGNPVYDSRNGCNAIIRTSDNVLVQGSNTTVIPNGITALEGSSFNGMGDMTSLLIPEGITSLGDMTFYYCNSLEEINIPSTVTEGGIGSTTFYDCPNLRTIRCYIRQPFALPTDYDGPFGNNDKNLANVVYEQATLYVPYGTKALYESTEGWNRFKNIVEMENNVITVDLINNGDMEGSENSNFYFRNLQQSIDIYALEFTDGAGKNGSRGLKVETTAKQDEVWDNQLYFYLNQPVSEGTKFKLSFDYRAEQEANIYISAQSEKWDYIWDWTDPYIYSTPNWQTYTLEGTIASRVSSDQKPLDTFAFSLNQYAPANTYYFDNVVFEVYLEDQCPKPTFKKNENEVTIQSPFDATIYYTLDGSEPTTNSEHATGAIALSLSENTTIKAIAVVEGYEVSPVATYAFEYSTVNFSFDGLTARVSGGATLDEALAEDGGREEAAKTIAAIIWENTTALTADMLQGIDNPNLLVYVNEASQAPQGIQNVVINGQAKEIILTDAATGNNNWYCPQAFTAEKISYTRNFSQQTEPGISRGWEGIALPFNVGTITHETNGRITPFGVTGNSSHFWLRTLSQNGLVNATRIEANTPYVISMPNNTAYPTNRNLNGRVTFSASNVTVPATPDMDNLVVTSRDIILAPAYQSYNYEEIYAINVGQARGNYAEGSVFERGLREVRPFEAFTVHEGQGARPRYIPIVGQTDSEATGINNLTPTLSEDEGEWYDLSGRKLSGEPKTKGVYIQNGKKIRVK